MNSAWRDRLDRSWSALEETSPSGERALRIAELPVETVDGPLALAIDHKGHRHVLVPVRSHTKPRGGLNGPVLELRRRPLMDENSYQDFLDLGCLRSDVNDVFTSLCGDIVKAAQDAPDNPVKALYQVIDRWKALFQTGGPLLGPEQVSGLFGELLVLEKLLHTDPSAHRLWRGPSGHRHDFGTGVHAVEVKSVAGREGRRIRIHGLDQLEAPPGGTLRLAWFKLERATGAGLGLVELIDRTMRLCDDEIALLTLLAVAGYRSADAERYGDVRFVVFEESWYDVDDEFPKLTGEVLTGAGVTVRVREVDYTIDLPSDPSTAVAVDDVDAYLRAMIEESV
ncbi:PD-(D/E)XK motif protein [Streptomyces sp. NPDC091266]|uniref:PD-(D/E)XK motif protein n=1 Tax=Streptomyces sp. NPDC091266 TaxID=3365978 RepID=UPI00380C3902